MALLQAPVSSTTIKTCNRDTWIATKQLAGGACIPLLSNFRSSCSTFSPRTCSNRRQPRTLSGIKAESSDSRASQTGPASSAADSGASVGAKKPTVIRRSRSASPAVASAEADNIVMRAVEEQGISVEGVAKVDRESTADTSSILRIAAMAGGDVASLILFAWIGRATHVSTAVDFELLKTADPFIAGWVAAAYFLGEYLPDKEPPVGVKASALSAIKTWAVGVPLGIAIRSLGKGELPPLPFVAVSMASTLVLLVGWRSLFAATLGKKNTNKSPYGNRQGNPLEFLELLTSLVRRW